MAATTTPNYSVDYEDERFKSVEAEETKTKSEVSATYDNMVNNSDSFYDAQIDAAKEWADTQSKNQQARTDFTIETIEQQKDKAHKDYIKEQSGAYVDWQNQSAQHGVNAEKMASQGVLNSGYSESSQVSMYNTYQNRIATARESYNNAVLNYDNAIKDAQLQNNEILAQIAYTALETQLSLSLEGFQYKNQLIMDKTDKMLEIDSMYYDRWKGVLDQINTENALNEDARQFNENLIFQETENEKDRVHESTENEKQRTWQSQEAELDRQFQADQAEIERKYKSKEAELERKHDKEMLAAETKAEKEKLEIQHKNDMAKLAQQQKNELAQLDKKLANDKALLKYENSLKSSSTKVSGSSSKASSSSSKISSSKSSSSKVSSSSKSSGKISSTNILDMGYGPISASKASSLVDEGKLTYKTDKNGNVTFSKTAQSVSLPTWDLLKSTNKVKK